MRISHYFLGKLTYNRLLSLPCNLLAGGGVGWGVEEEMNSYIFPKPPQVSRTLLNILGDLNDAAGMVSIFPLIFNCSN